MLPDYDRVIVQVGDVGAANAFRILLHDHPTEVRIEEALADGIGIFVGVGVTVMGAMISGPPADRTFDCSSTHGCKENLQWCPG